jgi:hypothetical protein
MAIGRLVPGSERGLRVDSKGGANLIYLLKINELRCF